MKLDVTINVLRKYSIEDGTYSLVVGFDSLVQPFPIGMTESRARLSILEEINSVIAEKIDEINKRQSERSDSERYPDLESSL